MSYTGLTRQNHVGLRAKPTIAQRLRATSCRFLSFFIKSDSTYSYRLLVYVRLPAPLNRTL